MRLRRLRNKRTAEESAGLNEGSEGFEPFSEAGAATPATHAPASVRSRAEKKSALLSLSSTRRGSKRRRFNETYSDDERDGDQNEDQDESDAGAGIDEDNFVVSDDDESEESELGPPIIHDSNTVAKGRQDPLYTLTLGALDQRNSLAFFKASIDSLLPDCTPKKLLRPLPYNKGRSLVHTTCAALRPDILRYLLDLANSDKNSDPPLTRRVLEGVDSDDGSSGGCTPVHIAAAMGSLESLQTIKDAVNLCRKATAAAKASTATLNLKSRSRQVISDEEDDDSNSDFDDSEGWDTELLLIQDNEGFSPICRAIATKASQQVIQFLLDWMKEAGCVFAELSCVPDEESKESINDDADLTDCGILFVAARMGRPSVFHACQKTFGPESILPAMSTRTKGSGATILHYACAAAFILGTPAALECVRFIVQFYDSHGLNKLILVRDNTNLSRDQLLKAATQSDRKGSPKFSRVAALYALGVGVPWDVDEELKPGEEFEEIDYTVPRCFFKLEADNVVEDAFNVVMEANVEQEHERELQELQAHEAKDETIARVVECLVDAGTSMAASEDGSSGATMLHFAALNGFERVVRFLTSRGLSARIKDKLSLTPLIYAHMSESLDKVSDGCLLALLESDPSQLEELMLFLEMSRQHTKLVKNLMKSLATKPRAYKFVNSFLRGIIKSTKRYEVMEWFAGYPQLLDFKNREVIFRRAVKSLMTVDASVLAAKESEFMSAYEQLSTSRLGGACLVKSAKFKGSIGSGPGVLREFWDNLSMDMIRPRYGVFAPFSATPGPVSQNNEAWDSKASEPVDRLFFARDATHPSIPDSQATSRELTRFAGKICALAIINNQLLPGLESLSPQVLRIVVEDKIEFSWKDFETIDEDLFKGWQWLLENPAEQLCASFSVIEATGDGKTVTKAFRGYNPAEDVTDQNKEEYVKLCAKNWIKKFRYKIVAFREGFTEVIPREMLRVLGPADLELLLCGVPVINIDDWRKVTTYTYYSSSSVVQQQTLIDWFWSIVRDDMNEADRALLLKFSTGLSRTPPGGFLSKTIGEWRFQIYLMNVSGTSLPSASTCFNLLKLPNYISRDQLREKLLMAIRHGTTGFEFV